MFFHFTASGIFIILENFLRHFNVFVGAKRVAWPPPPESGDLSTEQSAVSGQVGDK